MSEGVQTSGQPAGASHALLAAVLPILVGVLAVFGYWSLPSGSHSGETLLVVGLGLILCGGLVGGFRRNAPNPREYFGGLALLAMALFAIWASNDLPGIRGFAFGPGTGPRLFAIVLGLLSIAVMLVGLFVEGPGVEQYDLRAPVLIVVAAMFNQVGQNFTTRIVLAGIALLLALALAARGLLRPNSQLVRGPFFVVLGVVFFAVTIRHFGLVITSYVTMVLTSFASNEMRLVETLIWAAVMTAFCSLLFPVALNLPLQLWPVNFSLSNLINLQ